MIELYVEKFFYKVDVVDVPTRKNIIKKHIDAHKKSSKSHEESFWIKKKFKTCRVINLAIEIPVYHMNNGRTRSEQTRYIAQNNKKDNFFYNNQENNLQQKLQHKTLVKLSQQKTANIHAELKKSKNFREDAPILLDNTGMVINGNRRLAAIRELYQSDAKKYHMFKTIPCAIVEERLDPKDVKDIENFLQVKKEHKADYDWISLALEIKDERNRLGYSNKEISQSMDIPEKEIERQLEMVTQIEECLEQDWKKPKAYELVINQQQLWFNTSDRAKKKKGSVEEKSVYLLGRLCSLNADETNERIYKKASILQSPSNIKPAMKWLMDRQHIKPVKSHSEDSILGQLKEKPDELLNIKNLNKIKIQKKQMPTINQLIDHLVDSKDDKAPLKYSEAILDKTIKLSGMKMPSSNRKEIARNLKKTISHCERIINKVSK